MQFLKVEVVVKSAFEPFEPEWVELDYTALHIKNRCCWKLGGHNISKVLFHHVECPHKVWWKFVQ